jgi:uncharacterized protein YndB with AHSA1/START domain
MLKTIAVVIVVLIAGVLVAAAMQPDNFRVQRSIVIKAPPATVFALINHLPSWKQWSPYEVKDPDMQRQFSGPESGVGAAYAWSGDKNVGKGDMQITAATEPEKIVIALNFIEPFKAHNVAEFDLATTADGTQVTWAMSGAQSFIGKIMCLFFNMDHMVGGDFEIGLANLKSIAEK